jgi:hypothetical protein
MTMQRIAGFLDFIHRLIFYKKVKKLRKHDVSEAGTAPFLR